MNIVELPVSDIQPYYNNPRNNDKAVDVVAISIEEFGFQVPIIVDSNNIVIAGHTRLEAAKKLGMETVPVVIASELSEAKAKAFRIMDNKASEASEWDYKKLVDEFDQLETLDCNMETLGFDLLEIEKLKFDFTPYSSSTPRDEYIEDDDDSPFDGGTSGAREFTAPTPIEEPKKNGNPIIQYNLVFNDEDEQQLWYAYIRHLKTKYPECDTISERLIADIKEQLDGSS